MAATSQPSAAPLAMKVGEEATTLPRPRAPRSLPFYGCMAWVPGLVPKARQPGGLKETDIPNLPRSLQSEQATAAATTAWERQLSQKKRPSLLRVLLATNRFDLIVNVVAGILMGLMQCLARPFAVRLMVNAAKNQKSSAEAVPELLCVGAVIFLEGLVWMISRHAVCDIGGARIMNTLAGLVVNKAGRILDGAKKTSDEKVLVSVDTVGKVNSSFGILGFLVSNILGVLIGSVFSLATIGPATFAGLAIGALGMYVNISRGSAAGKYDKIAIEKSEQRMRTLNEILANVKGVKIHAWEERFMERMEGFRTEETLNYSLWHQVRSSGVNFGRSLPVLCSCATFCVFAVAGGELSPEVIFPTLAVFQGMRMPMVLLPMNLVYLKALSISFKRIEAFLQAEEALVRDPLPAGDVLAQTEKAKLGFWLDETFTPVLSDASCEVKAGEVVGIIGPVASGKSSLLLALLGEFALEAGSASSVQSLGFAPQKPVVISGTFAENIFVGRQPDASRLSAVLRMCCLDEDLSSLVDGLETEIGERGVTLSGGQQQRLAIARAMYDSPALLALDDPLSAVDVRTGAALMTSIVEYAHSGHGRGVVMVLNQPHCLAMCDKLVVLGDGGVIAVGPPAKVFSTRCPDSASQRSAEFFNLMAEAVLTPPQAVACFDRMTSPGSGEACDAKASKVAPAREAAQTYQLVKADVRQRGATKKKVYWDLVTSMGKTRLVIVFLVFLLSHVCYALNDLWLIHWTQGGTETTMGVIVLVCATLAYAGGTTWAAVLWYSASAVSGRRIFHDCMLAVLRAPLGWFDETPSGRVTSRFSGDLHGVDTSFAQFAEALAQFVFLELAVISLSIYLNPYFAAIAAVYVGMVLFVLKLVAALNRDAKRFGNLALSPVLTNITELRACRQAGLLRPMGLQTFFFARHHKFMEAYCRCYFTGQSLTTWGNFSFYVLSALMSAASALAILHVKPAPEEAGLQIVYCFILPFLVNLSVMLYFMVAVSLTQLERVFEMRGVPQEAVHGTCALPPQWPADGSISFRGASLRYKPGLPLSLQNVNLEIPSGCRVGLCGRTGSGKSSMMVMLLRLVELDQGSICLGGQSLRDIDLSAVRRAVAMIPQEPFLMQGSVRRNLDPFGDRSDEEISSALSRVGLNYGLDDLVSGGGANLSAGERQLLSFSRILLRDAKVVLLDEPTSSLDPMTDAKMGDLVRTACSGRTVLTIAHRLATIRDSHLVVVLRNGEVAESGAPEDLLRQSDSLYAKMLELGGEKIVDADDSNDSADPAKIIVSI